MTWEDVTGRGTKHPDLGPFFTYKSLALQPEDARRVALSRAGP